MKYSEFIKALENGNFSAIIEMMIRMLEAHFQKSIAKAHHDAEAIEADEQADEANWLSEVSTRYEGEYDALMDCLRDAIYCWSMCLWETINCASLNLYDGINIKIDYEYRKYDCRLRFWRAMWRNGRKVLNTSELIYGHDDFDIKVEKSGRYTCNDNTLYECKKYIDIFELLTTALIKKHESMSRSDAIRIATEYLSR